MIHILLILGGIAIGWLTKIPWFWKYYNEYKRENQEIRAMIDRIPEVFRKLEEEKNAKTHPPSPLEGSISDFTKSQKDAYEQYCEAQALSIKDNP